MMNCKAGIWQTYPQKHTSNRACPLHVQIAHLLLQRIQHRARQNFLLLRRSMELLDQFISSFAPALTPVYDGTGSLQGGHGSGAALYEAVG